MPIVVYIEYRYGNLKRKQDSCGWPTACGLLCPVLDLASAMTDWLFLVNVNSQPNLGKGSNGIQKEMKDKSRMVQLFPALFCLSG